ncbi:type I-E CRISPR-associated endoribonuclease Cas2e [Brachybacterium sp. p3-SID957]|uniref:type I-E CRISPR-associated endoribonuclease Cas2e n=1 Tax=Brachybacterium sp. p3-SID957 TaxID=2916049 RepID=UPI00223BDDB4|nr:type I-E CRISPR-associated endoribonuclease Cas2e [Brachybacterium sp. p3-SID957]MCT1775642.1 type I-E CRISPR-associated endoribonuclease Cas2e [Brachybacterium sp. p3-SID957]
MTLVLTAAPPGLRGDLTKWLTEISPGVFVGNPGARVRDRLWARTVQLCRDGRAILVYSSDNEQGLEFRVHNHDWQPVDLDGITLMLRPSAPTTSTARTTWSTARANRRSRRPGWAAGGGGSTRQ